MATITYIHLETQTTRKKWMFPHYVIKLSTFFCLGEFMADRSLAVVSHVNSGRTDRLKRGTVNA